MPITLCVVLLHILRFRTGFRPPVQGVFDRLGEDSPDIPGDSLSAKLSLRPESKVLST